MSRPRAPLDEPAMSKPEANRGLEDPRTIHPSPEGTFPEPGEMPLPESSSESDSTSQGKGNESSDVNRGIVDPRIDTIGPDIALSRT